MDDINVLHHRCLLNLRRRIRDIGDGRPAQERCMRLQKEGDTLSYQGNSEEVGCYVAGRPLSKGNCYFEVTIVDTGVRGTIHYKCVPPFYELKINLHWWQYALAFQNFKHSVAAGGDVALRHTACIKADTVLSSNNKYLFNLLHLTYGVTQTSPILLLAHYKSSNGRVAVTSCDTIVEKKLTKGVYNMRLMIRQHKKVKGAGLSEESNIVVFFSHKMNICQVQLKVTVGGSLLEYVGKGKSIMDVGLAQARQPLTTRCHYYEVEIVDAGEKCYIALGLARRDYPRNRHPGWSRGSVAYHADDGKIFHGSGVGDAFGPRCFKGDIMGCGIMFPRDYIMDGEGEGEGDAGDWGGLEVRPCPAAVQNVLYLKRHGQKQQEKWERNKPGAKNGPLPPTGKALMSGVFFTRNGKLMG
uniref:SPRY domain containing 3 n=1 Tax=Gasterosteus aculeatus TaxID=69293 RepID=G3P965_GASAC